MQVRITQQEKSTLIQLTAPKGRTKWFYEGADITWPTLQRLRTLGMGDESVVKKMRSFLKTKEAKALIAQELETDIVS